LITNDNAWKSIQELFQAQSLRTPDSIAVVDGSVGKTYHELDIDSDMISRAIQAIGVTRNELVAILMESSYDYIQTTLGILKAGAVFLPISTDLPDESISAILQDAAPRLMLTDQQQSHRGLQADNITRLTLNDMVDPRMWGEWSDSSTVPTQSNDLAFATYTSGTTGEPKGVLQTQLAMVASYGSRYDFQPYQHGERVACNIFFMWEFLRPLLRGATCYVIPDTIIYTPRKLADFLAINKITEVLVTPSVLQALVASNRGTLRDRLSLLRTIWLNGEVVTHELIIQARANLSETVRILNTYSICECHDVANYDTSWVPADQSGPIPVGYPAQDVKVMVMPLETDEAISKGTGELYIGGNGLAHGYLGQPELTRKKFINIENSRFYATGDLAEIRDDNLILIYGRCDSMVKIRGYSVPLGAIEQALRTHCDVSEAVVLANGAHLAQHLTAYVVRGKHASWSIDTTSSYSHDLRAMLSSHLPAHMIPTKFIEITTVPINLITGKADHKALSALDTTRPKEMPPINSSDDTFENIIQKLWAHALEVAPATIKNDSDFFDLGGHSLSAVTLTLDIEEFLERELEGTEVYDYPIFSDFLSNIRDDSNDPKEHSKLLRFWDDASVPFSEFIHQRHDPLDNVPTYIGSPSAILITGATGFLGGFLLDSIANTLSPDTKIYCLVREASETTTNNRLHNSLLERGIDNLSATGNRVITLQGDIEKPCLGLDDNVYGQLSDEVGSIFHCAANVNLQYGYSQLRDSIVIGTSEVLKFATYRSLKSIHYVSSNAVFPDIPGRLYADDTDISTFASTIQGGYNQAKWVADRLAQRARAAGIPMNIYRPGNIGPHTSTGSFNTKDLQTMILKACMIIQAAPSEADWQFEMTPVDVVASVIAQASLSGTFGKNYNIVQDTPFNAPLIFSRLLTLGFIREFLPLNEWFAQVAATGQTSQDKDLIIIGSTKPLTNHALTSASSFACENFLSAQGASKSLNPQAKLNYIDQFIHAMHGKFSIGRTIPPTAAADTHIPQESTL